MSKNNETKAERFKRLAEKRTRKVLEDLRILSNLSNKGLYEYAPEQLRKVFGAISDAFEEAKIRFKGGKKTGREFEL